MAKFFRYAFGDSGDKTAVPDETQVDGSVSYEQGYGSDYQKNLATDPDAKPYPRPQSNQLYFDITNNLREWQTQAVPEFIDAADNGGVNYPYPIYALVRYDSGSGYKVYESREDSNNTLPTDATKWRVVSGDPAGVPIGTMIDFAGPVAPDGYLACDGSAVSRTTYADLFAAITETQSGTLTTGNAVVTGLTDTSRFRVGQLVEGSGVPAGAAILTVDSATQITLDANATSTGAEDLIFIFWGAGDGSTTFNLPDRRRTVAVGSGGSGSATLGNGVGQSGGAETHTLSIGEMPAHTHPAPAGSGNFIADGGSTVGGSGTSWQGAPNTGSAGSGGAHNNMQPSTVCTVAIRYL